MLGALSSGGVLKRVALADQGTVSRPNQTSEGCKPGVEVRVRWNKARQPFIDLVLEMMSSRSVVFTLCDTR